MDNEIYLDRIYRIVNKYNAKTREPRDYGFSEKLYSSEVHMLETIGEHNGVTGTEIARLMGITKGAVSQTAGKLLKKGLIEKKLDGERQEIILILPTELGWNVIREHRKFHEKLLSEMNAALEGASKQTLKTIDNLLNVIDTSLDQY